jgi:uncharacterized protein YvpB
MRKHIVAIVLVFGFTVTIGAGVAFAATVTQSPLDPSYTRVGHAVDKPFVVRLGSSVASIGAISITPEIKGTWMYHSDMFGVIGAEFSPEQSFQPGTKYTVKLSGMKRQITGATPDTTMTFTTEEAPGVLAFSVPLEAGTVAADTQFKVTLNREGGSMKDMVLETQPATELSRKQSGDGNTWTPVALLPQGQKLTTILKDDKGHVLLERTMTVAAAPELVIGVKEVDVTPDSTLDLVFKEDIDTAKSPKDMIVFDASGKGSWIDATTYRFVPEGLEPGQTYHYAIAKGVRTKAGGVLEEAITKSFSTRGRVAVMSFSPNGREVPQTRQVVQVTFNQPVDKQSAEQRFSVSAGQVQAVAWEGNTLKATVVNLGFQTTVTVSVAAGVKPARFGLESVSAQSHSFTTEVGTVRLAVPYYKQAYAQSCEAASVRMALAYRGIGSSDWDILQKFEYNPTHKNQEANTWDDPQKQFVGDVNGNQGKGTGWGVYAEPVAAAVRSYGRQASTHYGVSAQFLAQQLYDDRPVVLWGIWGTSAQIQTWTTPGGYTASGPFPMHVRLVVGVKGSIEQPLGFYVHDPITGSAYWSTAQLMANTQKAGPANQAVVVY